MKSKNPIHNPLRTFSCDAAASVKLSDESVQRFLRVYDSLKSRRKSWEEGWKEIRDYLVPMMGRYLDGTKSTQGEGTRRNDKIIDGGPGYDIQVLASGMMSGMTPPSRPWFKLTLKNRQLMENHAVASWLEDVEKEIYSILIRSNFYQYSHSGYKNLALFGTFVMGVFESVAQVVEFVPLSVGTYYLANGADGNVNTVYRDLFMTGRQLEERFGRETLPRTIIRDLAEDRLDEIYHVIHAVEPNDGRVKGFGDHAFRSVYFLYDSDEKDKRVLSTGGYDDFPYICPRWELDTSDAYGIGHPGENIIGDVKMLQKLHAKGLRALDFIVDPPLLVDAGMKREWHTIHPGSTSFVNMNSPNGVKPVIPLYNVQLDLNALEGVKAQTKARISKMCNVELFLMLANSDKTQKTATEVAMMSEEQKQVLGPVVENFQTQGLKPLIERVYGICDRYGMLPPPPEEASGNEIEIEYISVLALAQKITGMSSVNNFIQMIGGVMQLTPEIVDFISPEGVVATAAEATGIPACIRRSDEDVAALRQARAQQQQQMQAAAQMQALEQGVKTAKTLSETDVGEGGNALSELMKGGGMQ